MADAQAKKTESGGWLRLPKMWADSEETDDTDAAPVEKEPAVATPGMVVRPAMTVRPGLAATQAEAPAPPAATDTTATDAAAPATVRPSLIDQEASGTDDDGNEPYSGSTADDSPGEMSTTTVLFDDSAMLSELEQMKSDMESMHRLIVELNDRESSMEQVFNTLHGELMDYKKDFIYEHLKPVVRPLLFLYDSLEQFDRETALYELSNKEERRQSGLSPRLVRENIGYFREQLVEALRICEVTLMETPSGTFNGKLHKAIDVGPVEPAQDNTIQRVVRAGWYLNSQLLRPAEVVVGKAVPRPGNGTGNTPGRSTSHADEVVVK